MKTTITIDLKFGSDSQKDLMWNLITVTLKALKQMLEISHKRNKMEISYSVLTKQFPMESVAPDSKKIVWDDRDLTE